MISPQGVKVLDFGLRPATIAPEEALCEARKDAWPQSKCEGEGHGSN